MLWDDMSYNQFDIDFLNKLDTEPEENETESIKFVEVLEKEYEEENKY